MLSGQDNIKQLDWTLAHITELISGRDGVMRVVRLQTKNEELVRPIQRLYPLDICTEKDRKQSVDSFE